MELLRSYARFVQQQLEREQGHQRAVSFMWCYAMVCHFWPEVRLEERARDRLVELIRPHAR